MLTARQNAQLGLGAAIAVLVGCVGLLLAKEVQNSSQAAPVQQDASQVEHAAATTVTPRG